MRHFKPISDSQRPDSGSAISASDRGQQLLRAAFEAVAESGFEGLRVRTVAARAGVNVATVHYYFESKEDLIRGLAGYLARQFVCVHAPLVPKTGRPALDWLRQGFADAGYYASARQDLVTVIQELALRAKRDSFVRQVTDKLVRDWRRAVKKMVRLGIADATFRGDLDAGEIVNLLAAVFSGASYLQPGEIKSLGSSVEALLLRADIPKNRLNNIAR
jgi:AcrR family transcriptional regulator